MPFGSPVTHPGDPRMGVESRQPWRGRRVARGGGADRAPGTPSGWAMCYEDGETGEPLKPPPGEPRVPRTGRRASPRNPFRVRHMLPDEVSSLDDLRVRQV